MDTISSPIYVSRAESKPDLLNVSKEIEDALHSINLNSQTYDTNDPHSKSFAIIDSNENFQVSSLENFTKKLGIGDCEKKVKVVSIFGNSGDGKSHTLNNVFFDGYEIFKMSSEQKSCTLGVWLAYQGYFYNSPILCVDTEGLQGVAQNENQQHRMLMKVLAVSDIIIYRTRAERLNSDMYKFLGTASKIYQRHLSPLLNDNASNFTTYGPSVIIFHEVSNTWPLETSIVESPENIIKEKFSEMKLNIDAFSSLKYVGIKTSSAPTDFNPLKSILKNDIENKGKHMRSIRSIYDQLEMLNNKFSGDVEYNIDKEYTLHESHFKCEVTCEGCFQRCENTRDHIKDGQEHSNSAACIYQQQLNNKIYLCKRCHLENRRSVVKINNANGDWLTKYTWGIGANSKIDCVRHGEIYRSRWYGNKNPEEICVLSEAVHIWRDGLSRNQVPTHSAQAIVDGFSYISDAISSVSAQPTKTVTSWVADNLVNPTYWVPNSEIIHCELCKTNFESSGLKIHHCRNCGKGVCNDCSKNRMKVPLKLGWGYDLVRVCNRCRDELMKNENERFDEKTKNVKVRKYGEVIFNAVSTVAAALEYPKELIKDSVRPEYWARDSESPSCSLCDQVFGNLDDMEQSKIRELSSASGNSLGNSPNHVIDIRRHHCRGCGAAVCNKCSTNRRPVPERGWNNEVRVCDNCWKKPNAKDS
ncbi:hypothetical protein PVAND_007855 [Polypedilum vanderplanki]|uniref:FYVE-type domain-containing protein n=1 Tax=Polypedilum vanderplanki TaxID=319348 RepID=A0A9J6C7W9_POLVA|nr:hypothetical protein PVAND_007855 [Polypedilum vanderplanki]